MNNKRISKLSHRISWLLRHGAGQQRLDMDRAGWANINDVLHHLHANESELDEVVRLNNKSRYEIDGDRIRAAQGHSLEGMPVTQKALEASWARYTGDDRVWHGTHVAALAGISAEGILPGRRSHVHLAAEIDSRVGKRANVGVMLEVSVERLRARGNEVFVSANGVVLTRSVPPSCIVDLRALTNAARRQEAQLRSLLPS